MRRKERPHAWPHRGIPHRRHARLDGLLTGAERDGTVDPELYAQFRQGLLRHIAMEEKVLLPFARDRRGGQPLPIAGALRKDHGEIAGLLARSPTPDICAKLRTVPARHNPIEEGPVGLYATCDALAGDEAHEVVARMKAQPQVPVLPVPEGASGGFGKARGGRNSPPDRPSKTTARR